MTRRRRETFDSLPLRRASLPRAARRAAPADRYVPDDYAATDGAMPHVDGDLIETLANVSGYALDAGELFTSIMDRLHGLPKANRIVAADLLSQHFAQTMRPENAAKHRPLAMAWRRMRTAFMIEGMTGKLPFAAPGTQDALQLEVLASRSAAANAFWASGIRLAAQAMPAGIDKR